MKRYEVVFIALSDLPKDEIDALIERYKAVIVDQKGIPIKAEKWGTRKLAYRIKKQLKGFYVLLDFAGDAVVVNELERIFKFDDKILRFLTIKKSDHVDMKELEKEMAGVREEKEEKTEEGKPEPARQQKEEVAEGAAEKQEPAKKRVTRRKSSEEGKKTEEEKAREM
ncbi:MAG: 30S ribosomal protein S6 [Syntrophales bacterium]